MENKSHALAAGTFVLVVMALLIALAVWLTRDTRALRVYELSSSTAVSGLQPQAAVRFKGVSVGKVTDIGFDRQALGQVLIRIAVDDQTPITPSTFATLGLQGVTGLAYIQLDDKGESKQSLPTREEAPARIPMRPSLLSKVTDRSESLLLQLDESSQRLKQLLSEENQKRLMGSIDSLGRLSDSANEALPQLVQSADAAFIAMKDTSVRVSASADEARASARAFRTVTERMSEPGGTLDKLAQGVDTLGATTHNLNAATLPRLNRAVDDTARMTREVGRTAGAVKDNPQSLLLGNGAQTPGPGEPGFSANRGKP